MKETEPILISQNEKSVREKVSWAYRIQSTEREHSSLSAYHVGGSETHSCLAALLLFPLIAYRYILEKLAPLFSFHKRFPHFRTFNSVPLGQSTLFCPRGSQQTLFSCTIPSPVFLPLFDTQHPPRSKHPVISDPFRFSKLQRLLPCTAVCLGRRSCRAPTRSELSRGDVICPFKYRLSRYCAEWDVARGEGRANLTGTSNADHFYV